jgi:DNA polymerase/3'-5' exonuclease PolX
MNLIEEIREYISFMDDVRLRAIREGTMSVEDAKKDVFEMEKWREKLAELQCVGCRGTAA